MRRLFMLTLLLTTAARADEVLTSSTPPPMMRDAPVQYELTDLRLRIRPARIDVRLTAIRADGQCAEEPTGQCQSIAVAYTGEDALALLNALNSANLTTKSLRRRVIERLQADGYLPTGTISGSAGLPTSTATVTVTSTPVQTHTPTITPTGEPTATATATP